MTPHLSDEHRELQRTVREFGRDAVAPVARDLDARSAFPWENVAELGRMGLLGVPVPRELGGMGLDYLSYVLVIEELARWDASHAITVSAHTTLATLPIVAFGTDAQRERFVPPLATGRVLGGFGLTEAGAGSDAAESRTRAERVEGGYRLDGAKLFITHAGVGEIFVVAAVTDPSAGSGGITSFVVTKPTTDPEASRRVGMWVDGLAYVDGVRAGRKEDKMGWRASDTRELVLERAFVPEANRLGEEGEGFANVMKTLDSGRIGLAALAVGLARGALDETVALVTAGTSRDRIWDDQQVRFALAGIATEIEAGRHLTYHAARLKDEGRPYTKEAAMAKLFCSELAMRATLRCIDVMGVAGYSEEYPIERMARDAKVCEIGEGTSEIQRLVISRHLLREAMDERGANDLSPGWSGGDDAGATVHTS